MKRSLVHLMLGFLICLTSLQGVAAELLACCGPLSATGPHAVAGKGASHHAVAVGMAHAHHAADKPHPAHAGQACAACVVCCNVPAALPVATRSAALFRAAAGFHPPTVTLADHIPDTPERPPRHHAG